MINNKKEKYIHTYLGIYRIVSLDIVTNKKDIKTKVKIPLFFVYKNIRNLTGSLNQILCTEY